MSKLVYFSGLIFIIVASTGPFLYFAYNDIQKAEQGMVQCVVADGHVEWKQSCE